MEHLSRYGRVERHRKLGVELTVVVLCALFVAAHPVAGQSPEPIEPDKLAILEAYGGEGEDTDSPGLDSWHPESTLGLEGQGEKTADGPQPLAAREDSGSLAFYGTGGFGLMVDISSPVSRSYLGYVVNSRDNNYQDMVILAELDELGAGTYTIQAACTDLHKAFPPANEPMSSSPRTSDSSNNWAYWVRRASRKAWDQNYSFEELQAAIWYITDRSGEQSSSALLREVGYGSSGPTKNGSSSSNSNDIRNDDNWSDEGQTSRSRGSCGAVGLLPVPLCFGMLLMRCVGRCRRR